MSVLIFITVTCNPKLSLRYLQELFPITLVNVNLDIFPILD